MNNNQNVQNKARIIKDKLMRQFPLLRKIFSVEHFASYCEDCFGDKYFSQLFLTVDNNYGGQQSSSSSSSSISQSFEQKLLKLLEILVKDENHERFFYFINYIHDETQGFQILNEEFNEISQIIFNYDHHQQPTAQSSSQGQTNHHHHLHQSTTAAPVRNKNLHSKEEETELQNEFLAMYESHRQSLLLNSCNSEDVLNQSAEINEVKKPIYLGENQLNKSASTLNILDVYESKKNEFHTNFDLIKQHTLTNTDVCVQTDADKDIESSSTINKSQTNIHSSNQLKVIPPRRLIEPSLTRSERKAIFDGMKTTKDSKCKKNEPFCYCDIPQWNYRLGSQMKHGQDFCRLVWTGKWGDDYICIADFLQPTPGGTDGVFDGQRLYHSRSGKSCKLILPDELESSTESRMPPHVKSCNIDDKKSLLQKNHLGCSIQLWQAGKSISGRLCWCGTINGEKFAVVEFNHTVTLKTNQWRQIYESQSNQDKFALLSLQMTILSDCDRNSRHSQPVATHSSEESQTRRHATTLPNSPNNQPGPSRSVSTLPTYAFKYDAANEFDDYI